MAGHSKWETTHRQKAVADAKKGAMFTKLANLITIAAKKGGGDLDMNPSLRTAVDKARGANMPKDNIERAIKKGTGELAGDQVEELLYEGVIPPNIQIIVRCLTDNKNRSGATVRHLFTKNGGALSSVLWNFKQLGVILLKAEVLQEKGIPVDNLELELIDQGILDLKSEEEGVIIHTEVVDFINIKTFLENKGLELESAELEYVANNTIELSDDEQAKLDKIIEDLEDNEDINDFYFNVS